MSDLTKCTNSILFLKSSKKNDKQIYTKNNNNKQINKMYTKNNKKCLIKNSYDLLMFKNKYCPDVDREYDSDSIGDEDYFYKL